MSATSERHWLDRLAVRLTRRQSLKAAVGGALALPLLKAATPARAASGDDCYKGCMWTTHQEYDADGGRCGVIANGKFDAQIVLLPFTLGFSFFPRSPGDPFAYFIRCVDNAALKMKQHQAQCRDPGCPGFQPRGKYGPCDGCAADCCPWDAVDQGYYCCTIVEGQPPCWCTMQGG
jgi:hypothetical protein